MANYKLVDAEKLDADLGELALAIRMKTGTELKLSFPTEMIEAITGITSGNSNPYVEYKTDDSGTVIEAVLYNFEEIPARMFYGNTALQSIDTSHSPNLASVGSSAFFNCSKLALTSLPESITSIGSSAFYGCSKLALTSLPESITSIGSDAFYNCSNLALTSLPKGITSIESKTFYNCGSLALTSLPDGVTSIGSNAFMACDNLALTALPESITSIGSYAFSDCTNLALTALPESITSIEAYTFRNCSNLALTALPDGVTSIGSYAFSNCDNLALTALPDGMTSIGSWAFNGCIGIKNIEINGNLISDRTFYNCTGLEKVWLRNSCTSISAMNSNTSYAHFAGCSDSLEIYAEPTEQPSGWGKYFNRTGTSGKTTVTVVYGQTTCPW